MKNRLPKLYALNKSAARTFRAESSGSEATIYIYDVIGEDFWTGEGVTAKRFIEALDKIDAKTINLRINSPGGDVFESRAITAIMDNHPARFVAHVDGIAASAASFIAARADEIVMSTGSMLMIHNAWTMAAGNRHYMLDTAAFLEKIDATIADDYAARGADRESVVAMMDAETWLTAEEAIAAKLADRIAEKQAKASMWNLSAYDNAPEVADDEQDGDEKPCDAKEDVQAMARERALRLAVEPA